MKIILSRKGWDSSFGGYPSPIFPQDTMLSFPIPNWRFIKIKKNIQYGDEYFDGTAYHSLRYKDLKLPKSIITYLNKKGIDLKTYRNLIDNILGPKSLKDKKNKFLSSLDWYCHLDPDIRKETILRNERWKPLFGQTTRAQSHLNNNNIASGDIFLFFGRFAHLSIKDRCIKYKKPRKKNQIHLIFGYFQIDHIINTSINPDQAKQWMKPHPHLGKILWEKRNNTIYTARSQASWDSNISGAGSFQYSDNLILTELDQIINPKNNLTKWKYNFIPEKADMTYHSSSSWVKNSETGNYFKSASIGQEFVINNASFTEKIQKLIKNSKKSDDV